jgi:hypothetical protein
MHARRIGYKQDKPIGNKSEEQGDYLYKTGGQSELSFQANSNEDSMLPFQLTWLLQAAHWYH